MVWLDVGMIVTELDVGMILGENSVDGIGKREVVGVEVRL